MAIKLNKLFTTMSQKITKLNSKKIDISVVKNICSAWVSLTTTATAASNWTVSSISSALTADKIHVYFSVTRSSQFSAGNITNQKICTVTIKPMGRIVDAYNISFNQGATGTMAALSTNNMAVSGEGADQVLTFSIQLNATHAAGSSLNGYFYIPVIPNVSYYS